MNFIIICALLISGLRINIAVGTGALSLFNREVIPFLKTKSFGGSNVVLSPFETLVLIDGGKISETNHSIVWKGHYKNRNNPGVDVAVKLSDYLYPYIKEVDAIKALNATKDPQIESYDIPRVYYQGNVLSHYLAIATTLFDGSLNDLYERYKGQISELQILEIFKQAVRGLKYLHSKNVVHNDIEPQNIFLHGSKVFIGDFDKAEVNGLRTVDHSKGFASSGFYDGRDRYALDDLESLVFSMFYIAGIPLGESNGDVKQSEGKALLKALQARKASERVLEKCKHFKNPKVFEAFKAICVDEMIFNRKNVPNYDLIIDTLDKAIIDVRKSSEPVQFHWLTDASGSGSA